MKPSRPITCLFCAIPLFLFGGCGGGTSSATIGGTIVGLASSTSIFLLDNNADQLYVNANGPFHFNGTLGVGAAYSVTVLGQTCNITNGAGTVDGNADSVSN